MRTTPTKPVAAKPLEVVAPAREVRAAGAAPAIEMTEALGMARRFADKHEVHFDRGQYLQGAVFDAVARTWVFDWQVPSAKGGITIITVHESGQISINYGE